MSIQRILDSDEKVDLKFLNPPTSSSKITVPIQGVTDGSQAQPGEIGEFIQQGVSYANQIDITTNNDVVLVTVNLPAGRWLVFGNALMTSATPLTGLFQIILGEQNITPPNIFSWNSSNALFQSNVFSFQSAPIVINKSSAVNVTLTISSSSAEEDGAGVKASGYIYAHRIG